MCGLPVGLGAILTLTIHLHCSQILTYTQDMLTLSKLKYDIRKIFRFFLFGLGFLLLIYILYRGAFFVKEKIRPSPPTPPQAAFGKLPKISFPKSVTEEKLTYQIDTLSGNLPTFPHLIDLYLMRIPPADLLALQKANKKASAIGFEETGKKISGNVYEWKRQSPKKALRMNIRTFDFFLRSDLSSASAFFNDPNSESEAMSLATKSLSRMDLLYEDIDTEKTIALLFSIQNGSLIETSSLSNAQAIRVYFFQKDVSDYPVYYPNGKSPINLVLAYEDNNLDVKSADFLYQAPNLNKKSTYSIKTSQEAFEELKIGKGYIAKYVPSDGEILIKNVYLGYYIGEEKQQYLLPIFVFEGNNFLAYVSSLKDEWIKN